MTESAEHNQEGCCGGHGAQAAPAALNPQACSGHADACGADAGACCGGHDQSINDVFAFPATTEVVSIPAVQLAGLLDLVEKLAAEPASLASEDDYLAGQRILNEQAPQLVALRDEFLERMKTLLSEAVAAHSVEH